MNDKGIATGADQGGGETPTSLVEDIERAAENAEGENISVGQIVDAFGSRSYGALLIIPALITIAPTGSIPGVPTAMAVWIALVSGQLIFRNQGIWLPNFLKNISFARDRVAGAAKKSKPWFGKLDSVIGPRLQRFASGPGVYAIAASALVMALVVPPLEIIPYAVVGPSFVFLILGFALSARDGLWALVGMSLSAVVLGIGLYLLL